MDFVYTIFRTDQLTSSHGFKKYNILDIHNYIMYIICVFTHTLARAHTRTHTYVERKRGRERVSPFKTKVIWSGMISLIT